MDARPIPTERSGPALHGALLPLLFLLPYAASFTDEAERLLLRTSRKPFVDLRPGTLRSRTARHHADMTTVYLEQELILAADFLHDALRLARRRDVVGERDHVEQVGTDIAKIDALTANKQVAGDQLVLLVQLLDQLAIAGPRHRDDVSYPGVHGVPRLDDARIVQVIP